MLAADRLVVDHLLAQAGIGTELSFQLSDDCGVVAWTGAALSQEAGLAEMLLMPGLVRERYGPACQLFRHGFDRDPVGDRFVRNNQETIFQIKKVLHNA